MNEDFHLTPLAADADAADLLEALGPLEERPPESQYCVFRSGRERFCFPVLDVEEVLDWPLLTRLPLAPAYLLGIFNLRGVIVPLIDIAMTEGRKPGLLPKHVVVASLRGEGNHDDVRIGIAADEVIGTYSAPSEDLLEQAPENVPHCVGMLRHDDRLALLSDLRRLLEVSPAPSFWGRKPHHPAGRQPPQSFGGRHEIAIEFHNLDAGPGQRTDANRRAVAGVQRRPAVEWRVHAGFWLPAQRCQRVGGVRSITGVGSDRGSGLAPAQHPYISGSGARAVLRALCRRRRSFWRGGQL